MRLHLWSVCRRPPAWVTETCADYQKRLRGKLALELRDFAPADAANPVEQKAREADKILKALPADALLVALDESGTQWTTADLAHQLDAWRQAARDVILVIGGAEGHDERVRQRAAQLWGLSRLTLPHQLARVIVVEQLYRAWTVLSGHPYHRA